MTYLSACLATLVVFVSIGKRFGSGRRVRGWCGGRADLQSGLGDRDGPRL